MKVKSNIYWIIIALGLALFCRSFLVSVFKIPTVSMAPTFWPGDFILSSQLSYGLRLPWSSEWYFKALPKAGDLIVFQFDHSKALEKSSAHYVKRVVAVGGDQIEIQDRRLVINGVPCNYTKKAQNLSTENFQVFEEQCQDSKRDVILSTLGDNGPLSTFKIFKVPENEVFVLGDNRDTSDDSRDLGTVRVDQIASKVTAIWLSYGSTQDFISGPNKIRWNRILTKPR